MARANGYSSKGVNQVKRSLYPKEIMTLQAFALVTSGKVAAYLSIEI